MARNSKTIQKKTKHNKTKENRIKRNAYKNRRQSGKTFEFSFGQN